MLRLVDPSKHHPVTIADIVFQMRSMSVREKFTTIGNLRGLTATQASYDAMVDILCTVIAEIEGHENVKETLNSIEHLDGFTEIINGVISYCALTSLESKNSDSSSDTSTPTLAGE